MKFGITFFPTEYTISIVDLARAAEDLGYESLFVAEHTHIPASRQTPYPAGGDLPREYSHVMDPFVLLSAAAAVTTRLRLGFGVCLLAQRDPIVTAKAVASLDVLSNGRVLFGVGGGWNHEEMENHGTSYARRWRILRERVLAMKAIWTEDEATFHGDHVNFDRIWSWPKPVQKPHPPILMGGNGPGTLERVVDYCDEWFPIPGRPVPSLEERVVELQQMAEAAGRGPIPVSLYGVRADAPTLERYRALGIHRCVFWPRPGTRDEVLPVLERNAALVRDLGEGRV